MTFLEWILTKLRNNPEVNPDLIDSPQPWLEIEEPRPDIDPKVEEKEEKRVIIIDL